LQEQFDNLLFAWTQPYCLLFHAILPSFHQCRHYSPKLKCFNFHSTHVAMCDKFCCSERTAFSTATCGRTLRHLRIRELSRIPFWNGHGVILPSNDAVKHSIARVRCARLIFTSKLLFALTAKLSFVPNRAPRACFHQLG
jgi:hypothetical protein